MHCAYALINLSTKQITDLHFISAKTVESARYRAKQKMNIGRDTLSTAVINRTVS